MRTSVSTILAKFLSNFRCVETGNLLDILILFGAIQGFISAAVLFRKKKSAANTLLASILIITSLACLNIYLLKVLPAEIPTAVEIAARVIPMIIIMPLGPLIYFYTKALFGFSFHFKEYKAHFISTILDLAPSLAFILALLLFLFGLSSTEIQPIDLFIEKYEKYVDIPRWISTSVYLFLSIKFILSRNIQGKTFAWVKQFLIVFGVFQLLWLFHLIPYLIPSVSGWLLENLGWYPIYIPLTILVYWLGLSSITQARSVAITHPIDDQNWKLVADQINELMINEQLFLNPTLSLNQLVEKVSVNQKTVSSTLNQYLGKSFSEYVNEFRVEEVKKKLTDIKYDHLSITGIALECGFNSQATFQRSFKALTKMTPKAFQENEKNRSKTSHS